jgi:hypothetical protein
VTVATNNRRTAQTASQVFRAVILFLRSTSGISRIGNTRNAAAAPGRVSVNAAVIGYLPFGVVADVVIVKAGLE